MVSSAEDKTSQQRRVSFAAHRRASPDLLPIPANQSNNGCARMDKSATASDGETRPHRIPAN
jgi:hypothetical protein